MEISMISRVIVSLKEFWSSCTYTCFPVKTSWLLLQVFQENKPQEFCIRSLVNKFVLMPCSWAHTVQVKSCHTVIVDALTLLWHFSLLCNKHVIYFVQSWMRDYFMQFELSQYFPLMQVIQKFLIGVLFLCNNYFKATLPLIKLCHLIYFTHNISVSTTGQLYSSCRI